MSKTSKAATLLDLFRKAGAKPYLVNSGNASTSKVERLVLSNAVPVVIEIDRETPNVWILPEHERGAFSTVGKPEHYEAGRGRHHHLDQVREFVNQALLKIPITNESIDQIRAAIKNVGTGRGSGKK